MNLPLFESLIFNYQISPDENEIKIKKKRENSKKSLRFSDSFKIDAPIAI